MALTRGARLGPFEILSPIGAGGMGEVYRARDTKLARDVAVKILPVSFGQDADRWARFQREAQVLASLNHPHIAAIYGLEDADGVTTLVMELVEGEDLSQRIARGAMALDEALPIASQIAEALEAAHAQGIVHRDLKPANIKVRPDGTVKVLDFGLAKAIGPVSSANTEALTSPAAMTATGVILGTAAYMSPEQARGRPVDKRTDIWAFGCVLYEMLTGQRAFGGKDATDVIAAILRAELDWNTLPAKTPEPIRKLLRRCLEKDRQRRLADASDARLEIDDAMSSPRAEPLALTSRPRVTSVGVAALAGTAMIATLVTWAVTRPAPKPPSQPMRFGIVPSLAQPLGLPRVQRDLALSPDGRHLVYRSTFGTGGGQLALRDIDRIEARVLEGITDAREPFFSPDGRWIGFFEGDELKKVSIGGGPAISLCQIQGFAGGASWDADNTIVFATTDPTTGLWRVSATGSGKPTVLTTPDLAQHEGDHLFPSMLPGSRGVLFTITTGRPENAQVAVLDLKSGQRKTLIRGGSAAQYVDLSSVTTKSWLGNSAPTGYLIYASGGTLRGVEFDLAKLEIVSEQVPVVDDVLVNGPGAANYAIALSGTLVYIPGTTDPQRSLRSLVWVDRKGHEEFIKAPLRAYGAPRLSPDGTRIVVDIKDRQPNLWIWDLARETLTPLTLDDASYPVWTADSRHVVFSSWRLRDAQNLFARAADGSGTVDQLTTSSSSQVPSSVTPDGTNVVGYEFAQKTQRDITLVALANSENRTEAGTSRGVSSSHVEPLVQTSFNELNGEVSPDGHYLAYQSDESGRYEVYVRPFPQVNAGRWQISTGGGTQPAWAHSGQELFYLDEKDLLTTVLVQTSGATFTAAKPVRVLDTKYGSPEVRRTYDTSLDGQRFLMLKDSADPNATPVKMVVVLNWFDELKARMLATK